VKKTSPPIPQQKATCSSPETEKDAEGQNRIEGNEATYLKGGVQNVQEVGKGSKGEVEGRIRQNSHVAPDIRSGRQKEEEMKKQIGTEYDPEGCIVTAGIALNTSIHHRDGAG
jgi:hypothetical protein